MKKTLFTALLTSVVSMSTFAGQTFEDVKGNNCVVLEVSTMKVLSEEREVLTKETSFPLYLKGNSTDVHYYVDDLYTKDGTTYSVFVQGDDFSIQAMKDNKIVSLSTSYHKGLLSFMDVKNSVQVLCNSDIQL